MPTIDPAVACSRTGLLKTYPTNVFGSNLEVCSQADHRVDFAARTKLPNNSRAAQTQQMLFHTHDQLEEGEFKPVMNAWWHSLMPQCQKHEQEIDCRSNDGAHTLKKPYAWLPTAENDELSDETQ
ncbi:uncharacterized protein LOC126410185 [Nymphaea colorata]|uniref:uncharacterized protein LOC126410185 n=1 Tax=Nymphaea colorata TaxID=210225 RepID=UPI00214F3D88|nr:uncharacterized protein LOC126410185 [Nymphaea colorata]